MRIVVVVALAACGRVGFDTDAEPPLDMCTRVTVPMNGGGNYTAALADFNGDGNVDIAASGYSQFTIALGDGAGGFAPLPAQVIGSSTTTLAVGDLDRDGAQDVAVVTTFSRSFLLFHGNGDGTVTMGQSLPFAYDIDQVTLADLDGDGDLDVVVSAYDAGRANVLLGNGDGTVGPPTELMLTGRPNASKVVDLNGDGQVDLVFAVSAQSEIEIWEGLGGGAFGKAILVGSFGMQTNMMQVAVGHLDSDTTLDLAVIGYDGEADVQLGQSGGGFASAGAFSLPAGSESAAVADFDGDGMTDLAVAAHDPDKKVFVYRGRGDGTFVLARRLASSGFTGAAERIAIGDVDHDGAPELVVASGENVDVYPNSCLR